MEFRHFRLHTVLWDPPGARGSHLKSQKRQSGLLEPKASRGKIVKEFCLISAVSEIVFCTFKQAVS